MPVEKKERKDKGEGEGEQRDERGEGKNRENDESARDDEERKSPVGARDGEMTTHREMRNFF